MKVALSILACLLVANAAVLPQNGLGVTKDEIDSLVKDSLLMYRNGMKKIEPFPAGSDEIPIKIQGLKVEAIDKKVCIGETLKYSESSSLSDKELNISFEIVQENANATALLHVTGTFQGKQVEQIGQIEVLFNTIGQKDTIKAQIVPYFSLVNLDIQPEVGVISVSITGINIEGLSKSDLESAIAESVKNQISTDSKMTPDDLEAINKVIGKHSLQEVYDALRKIVPST